MGILYGSATLLKIAVRIAIERDVDISSINISNDKLKQIWIDANKEYDKEIRENEEW